MTVIFKKAERKAAPLHLGITAPAKTGKSLGALLLMRGLIGPEGRMAVLDTEGQSSNLYADNPEYPEIGSFDVVIMERPFSYDKYMEFLDAGVEAGYNGLIFDSVSHAWAASGGVLERKDQITDEMAKKGKGGGDFAAWGPAKRPHLEFIDRMVHAPIHTICTWRLKLDYGLEMEGGKRVVKKLGLGPVQQPEFEYEFDIVFFVEHPSHNVIRIDSRAGIFDGLTNFQITIQTGEILRKWLDSGSEWVEPIRTSTRRGIERYLKSLGWKGSYKMELPKHGFVGSILDMTEVEAQKLLIFLTERLSEKETKQK